MARTSHRGGVGAIGSAKASFFHPWEHIRTKYPNDFSTRRLKNVVIIRDGIARVNKRDQRCYFVNIEGIDHVLHMVTKLFCINVPPSIIFDAEQQQVIASNPAQNEENQLLHRAQANIDATITARGTTAEEILKLRCQGIEVDNDNEPAPKNLWQPSPTQQPHGTWIVPTICPRRADTNISNIEGKWKLFLWKKISEMSEIDLFRMAFLEKFIIDVVIPLTNKNLEIPLTLQEFYIWLGCQFFMACFEGVANREEWWSAKPICKRSGAPFRLTEYIKKSRFLQITTAITYTDKDPPPFQDKFYDVRQLLDAFNLHYEQNYIPSWMNCLDESMSSWLNQYCPGFMFVPRKPHPSGNEYHSIADGDQGKPIMWRIKIQEGKDRLKDQNNNPLYPTEFENYTKTSALMLYMTKPIHNTGKIVTMDSGFCVAAGILALHHVGVYGQALIKKRGRYWPKHVPGNEIEEHMRDKDLGYAETYKQSIDGKNFLVHCQKDTDYVTKIMSTHGLVVREDHTTYRFIGGEWKSFKYVEPMS